jgi:hypothetical protein
MTTLVILILLFIFIFLTKYYINHTKYKQCAWFYVMYKKWVKDESNPSPLSTQKQVIKLFKDAGIEDYEITSIHSGYTSKYSIFNNFPDRYYRDVIGHTRKMFEIALGVYDARIQETFSPLYWIETIIYLPRRTFAYLGVSSESIGAKIVQVLWWAGGVTATFVFTIYKSEFGAVAKDVVSRIFP